MGQRRNYQPTTTKGVARTSWVLGNEHKEYALILEEWSPVINRLPLADENKTLTVVSDSALDEQMLLMEIRQPMTDEFNWSDFVAIGFSYPLIENLIRLLPLS